MTIPDPDLTTAGMSPHAKPDQAFGSIDGFEGTAVRGWAAVGGSATTPLRLEIFIQDLLAAETYTDQPRPDIVALARRPISAGFLCDLAQARWPEGPGPFRLSVRIAGHGARLGPGSIDIPVPVVNAARMAARARVTGAVSWQSDFMRRRIEIRHQSTDADIRAIAFYLPQFHPIPENDRWWGEGFTEWSNVTRARPLYQGHLQPHLPADLGFYDLRLPEIMERQAALAREHGIHGFCYYFYWFAGKRLLEQPIERMLASGKPDMPFCLCWANENWSRRWDGSEHELLMHQEHTLANDVAFIHAVIPYLKDPRYIRVHGAPILVVYRVSLFKDPLHTATEWRRICAEHGIPDIHLCMAETFGDHTPARYGFDSALEFPPHGLSAPLIHDDLPDLPDDFTGNIYDYRVAVRNALARPAPPYTLFRGAMLGWDNTARKGRAGNVFHHATPAEYEVWLTGLAAQTRSRLRPGERLLFINAWNEWAEGTHLEPDTIHGKGYLTATRRALGNTGDWRTLLATLRATVQDPDALLAQIDALEALLGAHDHAARHLQERVSRHEIAWGTTRLTDRIPASLADCSESGEAKGWIEAANQFSGLEGAVFQLGEHLLLRGWSFPTSAPMLPGSRGMIRVHQVDGDRRTWYGFIHHRHPRPDVCAAMGNGIDATILGEPGFTMGFRLDIPPGRYRLSIMHPRQHSVASVMIPGQFHVVP